ncbi:hypothetical protein LWI28_018436 [Acer negundo]|uniref:Uncharacterized protein n=1 Tax=Acer negundo TaxID=4023 RepID=A0AAD5NHH3_ACENE|nr:hypothetical protein LWI28_018436 [Acer negundo]
MIKVRKRKWREICGEGRGDDLLHSLDITDESSFFDGEVGMRLNQMAPVPHVPKINGELPSSDERCARRWQLSVSFFIRSTIWFSRASQGCEGTSHHSAEVSTADL